MLKLFFTSFSFLLFSAILVAQDGNDNLSRLQKGEDLNVLYRNEGSFGIFAHTAGGFGLMYRRGQHISAKRKRMFEIEAQNFKHPKEVKSISQLGENPKSYVYGKLNSFLLFRPGVGFQNVIYQKSDKKSVEIRYAYFVGVTLAFAKPIYLEIKYDPGSPVVSTERYDPLIHNQNNIYGKANYFTGIDKTTIYPGGYAKFALSFDYADKYNSIKSIETGAIVDVYPQVLPMMAYNENQQAFIELYLKIIWGKKWF